jgi:MFS transporter, DHA2 family, multidrug resistance protein
MSAAAVALPRDQALWQPKVSPWIIAVSVTLATFMEVLDTSIANVSLPHIAGGLSASQDESTWVLTSYLVSNAIVLPLSGWASTLIGRKRFYMTCVAIFTTSSFLCGLAPSLGWLIFFRVMQGAGGGGLQPSEQAILADTFPPRKRGMAFAVYGMAVVLAPAIGPTLGGWITDNYTWRWIFYINVPVGIASLLLTTRLIEDPPYLLRRQAEEKRKGLRIDYFGLGFLGLGLGTLQVVLDKGQRDDWFDSTFITVFTCIAVTSLIAAVIWEWFHKNPIVELHLFKDRSFLTGTTMMFIVGFTLMSTTLLLPQLLQVLMGYTAEEAGMALTPGGLVILLCMPLVGFMLSKYDARGLLAFGFMMVAIGLFLMARFNTDIDFGTATVARMVQAGGLAFLFVPINTAAYAYLPKEKNNAASGLINLARNIGGSFGISAVTTMLDRRTQFHQARLTSHMNPANVQFQAAHSGLMRTLTAHGSQAEYASKQAYAMLGSAMQRQAGMLAYIDNFWFLGLMALAMIPFAFLMKRSKPGGPMAVH